MDNILRLDRTAKLLPAKHTPKDNAGRIDWFQQFADAQRLARLGSWVTDLQTGESYWSDELYRLFGLEPDGRDMPLERFLALVHPDDRDDITRIIHGAVERGEAFTYQFRGVCADGAERIFHGRGGVTVGDAGKVIGIHGTSQDVTEQVRAEQELRATTARLEHLLSASPAVIYSAEPDGEYRLVFVNDNVTTLLGFSPQELKDNTSLWLERIHPEDYPRVRQSLQALLKDDGRLIEYRFRHKDGAYRWLQSEVRLVHDTHGEPLEIIGYWLDITERKQTTEALRESVKRYELISRATKDHISEWDVKTDVLTANRFLEDGPGTPRQKHGAFTWWLERIHPDDRAHIRNSYLRALAGDQEVWDEEYRLVRENGTYFHMRDRSFIVRNEQGEALRVISAATDITEQREAEAALKKSEQRFKTLVQNAYDMITLLDENGVVLYESPSIERIVGYTPEELYGANIFDYIHPDDQHMLGQKYQDLLQTNIPIATEFRFRTKAGDWRWLECSAVNLLHDQGVNAVVVNSADVTTRIETARALKESQQRLATLAEFRSGVMELTEEGLLDGLQEGFYERLLQKAVDVIPGAQAGSLTLKAPDGYYDYVATVNYDLAALKVVRFPSDEVAFGQVKPNPHTITTFEHQRFLSDNAIMVLRSAGRVQEIKAALVIPIILNSMPVAYMTLDNFDSKEAFTNEAVEMARIFGGHIATLLKRFGLEKELERLAYQDPLTELANRTLLKTHIDEALLHAHRTRSGVAVLFIDLDNLKQINDSLGHKAGDDVLRAVALRLQLCTRAGDMVARLSGDEFALVISSHNIVQDARNVAERIMRALSGAIRAGEQEIHTTASIGISTYPEHGSTADDLLKNADIAMYHAKNRGKNTYSFFTEDMQAAPLERLLLEEALRKALERNEFILHYQPRVDIKTGAVLSFEALVRWQHPERGLIPPGLFIPLAESTSLIHPLGRRVLEMASQQAKAWREQGFKDIRIAVNLSAKQLQRDDIIDEIREVLEQTDISGTALEIEVLESAAMTDVTGNELKLHTLKALGVRVSLDDFGTGYSSLSCLRDLPIDAIKIDRTFLEGIRAPNDIENNLAIIRAITALGKSLGLAIVAEGIEEAVQWELLTAVGCDEAQGYLISRPVPAQEAEKLLQQRKLHPLDLL